MFLIMACRLFGLCCALIFSFQLAAQPRAWNSVKAVAPGAPVRVAGPRPGTIQGVLQSVTDDSLVLNAGAGLETFSITQIKRISVKERGHRGRNALVGLGIGAGIGLVLGAVGDANCGTDCTVPKHFGIEALPPLFGGVGALVGAIVPSGGWREIYKQ
jgi:hypothetical protein